MRGMWCVVAMSLAACGGGSDGGNDSLDLSAWSSSFDGELTVTFDVTDGAAIVPSVETLTAVGTVEPGFFEQDPDTVLIEFGIPGDIEYRKLEVTPSSDSGGPVSELFFGNYLHPDDPQVTTVTINSTGGDASLVDGELAFAFGGTFTAQQGLDVASGTVTVAFP